MAFAATTTSAATGNWNTSGTWTAGVPDIDDQVLIQGGHTVTLDANGSCADIYVNGGILAFTGGYSLTVKDAAGTHATGEHIRIDDASTNGWNSNGTSSAPVVVKSQNTGSPTYRIKMLIEDLAVDTRTWDWGFLEMRDAACFLGNDTRYLWFNTGDVTNDGVIEQPSPMIRDQQIDVYYIEGRSYGRVHAEGGHAGTIDISGLVPWDSYDWQTMINMRDGRDKVAFQGQYVTLPSARIEALRFGKRAGPYVPFTLTLIEDW